MKKIFTLLTLALLSLGARATDYTGNLAVVVNGSVADPVRTTISLTETGGNYSLQLKNFVLVTSESSMGVGTINLDNVSATTAGNVTTLSYDNNITIASGDEGVEGVTMWAGPYLGQVPVKLHGTLQGDVLKAELDIPFGEMVIKVVFSSDYYQIPNSDFELFHQENGMFAPNHWHSFESVTGGKFYVDMVKDDKHTFDETTELRPGTTGSHSVKIIPVSKTVILVTVLANGTITTGRMNANSATADDPDNHAFIDFSQTGTDGNGDPFYAKLGGHPDFLKVWVKFNSHDTKNPNATVNAVITDGTYYQDPEAKNTTYNNVVAKATDVSITDKGAWEELTIPFSYTTNNVEPKAILTTISTNAKPGKGNKSDVLYVDDLSLVYNAGMSDLKLYGASLPGFDAATKTYDVKVKSLPTVEDIQGVASSSYQKVFVYLNDDADQALVTVLSEDLMQSNTYTLNFTQDPSGMTPTGITTLPVHQQEVRVEGVYNMAGQRVSQPRRGEVYVVRYSDGTATKRAY